MKTAATVLFFCLTINFTVWSQTTSRDTVAVLSADQLRTTALIFAKHEFLQKENALLKKQMNALQQSTETARKMISDYQKALQELEQNHAASDRACQGIVESYRKELANRKKKTRRRTIIGIIGGVAVGVIVGGTAF